MAAVASAAVVVGVEVPRLLTMLRAEHYGMQRLQQREQVMRGAKFRRRPCEESDHAIVRATLERHACVTDVRFTSSGVEYTIDAGSLPSGSFQCVERVLATELDTAISRHRAPSQPPPGGT